MKEPQRIGGIVKGVFEDIQRRYERPEHRLPIQDIKELTGRDMLAYLSDEIRRRGIGRKRRDGRYDKS